LTSNSRVLLALGLGMAFFVTLFLIVTRLYTRQGVIMDILLALFLLLLVFYAYYRNVMPP
jgi:hypothetical protein